MNNKKCKKGVTKKKRTPEVKKKAKKLTAVPKKKRTRLA